jgi:hypothetical protein
MKLHEWLYDLVVNTCYDRDYLYLFYFRQYTGLMNEILEKGKTQGNGHYEFAGLKNDLQVSLDWELEEIIRWSGSNRIILHYKIEDRTQGSILESGHKIFNLTTGEGLPDQGFRKPSLG